MVYQLPKTPILEIFLSRSLLFASILSFRFAFVSAIKVITVTTSTTTQNDAVSAITSVLADFPAARSFCSEEYPISTITSTTIAPTTTITVTVDTTIQTTTVESTDSLLSPVNAGFLNAS